MNIFEHNFQVTKRRIEVLEEKLKHQNKMGNLGNAFMITQSIRIEKQLLKTMHEERIILEIVKMVKYDWTEWGFKEFANITEFFYKMYGMYYKNLDDKEISRLINKGDE